MLKIYVSVNLCLSFINDGVGRNGKCKVQPRTGREGLEGEWRYSSILSLTSDL